jgi:hypothetical protein
MFNSMASAPAFSILRWHIHPTARRRAVQAGDDGNLHRRFRLLDVFQIHLRPDVKLRRLGKIRQRLGKTLRTLGHALEDFAPFERKLFLEQRVHHHRRRARVFHAFDVIHVLRERLRRRRHERGTKFQPR